MSEKQTDDTQETPEVKDQTEETAAAAEESAPSDEAVEPEVAAAEAEAPEAAGEEEEEFSFAEDPAFEIDYKGDCAYEVKVTIPPANEAKQAEELFAELKDEAELPGFRRGRAPLKLIQRKFGKAVKKDATAKLVSASFDKLIKDEDLRPLTFPDVDGLEDADERPDDQPIVATFKFEVAPRCELGTYRGIEIERPVPKVEDKDVEETIEGFRSRYAVYETLEEGEVQDGDQVIISFTGTIDGEEFQGGKADNYPYIMGTKRFFPEFEEVLTGSAPGADLSCEVSFGDDYSAQHLRGKTAQFAIKVNEVKRRNMPELNDEFAQQCGYDDLAAMRTEITEGLRRHAEQSSKQLAEQRAIKAIVEASTFELPKSMVDRAAQEGYEEEVQRLRSMRVPAAQIAERDEELKATAQRDAEYGLKSLVVLAEIADAEGIKVDDEDFAKEASALSERAGVALEQVAQFLEDEDRRSSVESRIERTKTIEAIMSNAKITDKEVDRETFEQMAQEEGE